jgi:hypothetical protein
MFLTLLSLALVGTADPAPRCLPAPAGTREVLSAPRPGGFRALALRRGELPRSSRRRSRDYLDPNDDSDEEGGAGARKVEPLAALLPAVQDQPAPVGAAADEPLPTHHPPHTRLIYALCTLLL